jgi:hypothetical protein
MKFGISERFERDKSVLNGMVYGSSVGGHRLSYLRVLSDIFVLSIVDDKPSLRLSVTLCKSNRVLFSTLDDSLGFFIFVSVIRSILLRRTVGLFLRPQTCFETFRNYYPWKKVIFKALKLLPGLTIATITPYDVAPEYGQVSHIGLTDVQYWDWTRPGQTLNVQREPLNDKIEALAGRRAILTTIGMVSAHKGLDFLADCLEKNPNINNKLMICCIGSVLKGHEELADRLKRHGAFVLGRFATDSEIDSAYVFSDAIWCCYSPKEDQASGVFGRAIQVGCPVWIRANSKIARLAEKADLPAQKIEFGDTDMLTAMLLNLSEVDRSSKQSNIASTTRNILLTWRSQFAEAIDNSL